MIAAADGATPAAGTDCCSAVAGRPDARGAAGAPKAVFEVIIGIPGIFDWVEGAPVPAPAIPAGSADVDPPAGGGGGA